jgi:hypothetical protein
MVLASHQFGVESMQARCRNRLIHSLSPLGGVF